VKVIAYNRRVQRYLIRQLSSPAFGWDKVNDPRKRRGRRWKLKELLNALLLGLVSGCPTLRDVEGLSEDMGMFGRKYVSRRASDTTLWDLIQLLKTEELREQLIDQVKNSWRAKMLRPVGIPCGVVSIDGKGLGKLEHDADGTAQKTHNGEDEEYFLSRSLRAVLVSAEGRPCLDQMSIGAKTNEMGDFKKFFTRILESYGDNNDLFEIITTDAGMTSLANADHIHAAMKAYVMALKKTQPELRAEAERLLGKLRKPEAETPWERYQGKWVRRLLFRTDEIADYHNWTHLRQAWRVVQETQDDDDKVEREERYFLTSVHKGRFTPEQILLLVRGHWRIENDHNWALDMQWKEDSVPYCSKGKAIEVICYFRLMAYNLAQQARRATLTKKLPDGTRSSPPAWRRVFEWIKQAWQLTIESPLALS
jgi:predicted transposase YbfD/YdcC